MNYLDVYFSRINHLGETTAERIKNGGIRSFEKWLAESPHTLRNLSVERGIYFDGIGYVSMYFISVIAPLTAVIFMIKSLRKKTSKIRS